MDMTYEEYVNFINHLFVQRMMDGNYFDAESTCDALHIEGA